LSDDLKESLLAWLAHPSQSSKTRWCASISRLTYAVPSPLCLWLTATLKLITRRSPTFFTCGALPTLPSSLHDLSNPAEKRQSNDRARLWRLAGCSHDAALRPQTGCIRSISQCRSPTAIYAHWSMRVKDN